MSYRYKKEGRGHAKKVRFISDLLKTMKPGESVVILAKSTQSLFAMVRYWKRKMNTRFILQADYFGCKIRNGGRIDS